METVDFGFLQGSIMPKSNLCIAQTLSWRRPRQRSNIAGTVCVVNGSCKVSFPSVFCIIPHTVCIVNGSWRFSFPSVFAGFLNGSWRFWFLAGLDNAVVKPLHRSSTFLEKTQTTLQHSRHSMCCEWKLQGFLSVGILHHSTHSMYC
jgi:hypothetical protein